jgi:hypothetical protein
MDSRLTGWPPPWLPQQPMRDFAICSSGPVLDHSTEAGVDSTGWVGEAGWWGGNGTPSLPAPG